MTVDPKTLYEMVKAAALDAQRALKIPDQPDQNATYLYAYAGYPVFVAHYNKFRPMLTKLYGAEAAILFPEIPQSLLNLSGNRFSYRVKLETVSSQLDQMFAYLATKLNVVDQKIEEVLALIELNLRRSIYEVPKNEKEVKNALETIFRVREYDFLREKITIPYSSKYYIPDFVFEVFDLAVEAKLCNTEDKVKKLVDEINADIVAYQTKYKNAIFVIYDLGHIRDEQAFKSGIEGNPKVHVKIIKQ
jgi:hypothetical protein